MDPVQRRLRAFYDNEMPERAHRPLGADRERRLASFLDECAHRNVRSVLEVGCGAGRDGTQIQQAGLAYRGIDLSPVAVEICRDLGLDAREGTATRLPFRDSRFDAAWTMSTLMHLDGNGMEEALAELARVVRPGGLVEIGVWGSTDDRERVDGRDRYFRQRSDDSLRRLLSELGRLDAFETWDWHDDGDHYQWARMTLSGPDT
jgi:SAM-dependent methyltransferase